MKRTVMVAMALVAAALGGWVARDFRPRKSPKESGAL